MPGFASGFANYVTQSQLPKSQCFGSWQTKKDRGCRSKNGPFYVFHTYGCGKIPKKIPRFKKPPIFWAKNQGGFSHGPHPNPNNFTDLQSRQVVGMTCSQRPSILDHSKCSQLVPEEIEKSCGYNNVINHPFLMVYTTYLW